MNTHTHIRELDRAAICCVEKLLMETEVNEDEVVEIVNENFPTFNDYVGSASQDMRFFVRELFHDGKALHGKLW